MSVEVIDLYTTRNSMQKECKHKALKIQVSDETYTKYGRRLHRVEIVCAACEIVIARAGTVYINEPEAIRGIIKEHFPRLLENSK